MTSIIRLKSERDYKLRKALLVLLAIGCWGGFGGIAAVMMQEKPAAEVKGPPYIPSEVQKLKLENAQLRAGIAQRDLTAAQKAWNEAAAALNAEAAAIKKENGWPDDLAFDFQSLKFTLPDNAGLDHKPGPAPKPEKEEKKEKPKP